MIACWNPPQVPTSGTPRSRASRTAASAPFMLRYGLPEAMKRPAYRPSRASGLSGGTSTVGTHSASSPAWASAWPVATWVGLRASKSPTIPTIMGEVYGGQASPAKRLLGGLTPARFRESLVDALVVRGHAGRAEPLLDLAATGRAIDAIDTLDGVGE